MKNWFSLSPRNKQFVTWMICIPLIAALVGFVLVSPGPVASLKNKPATAPVTRTVDGRGATPAVTSQQAAGQAEPSTSVASPVSSGEPATTAAPPSSDQLGNPVPSDPSGPPATPATRGSPASDVMPAGEFFALLKNNPEQITSITFLNGTDRIVVRKTGSLTQFVVTLPEPGGRQEALKLAIEKGVAWKAETDNAAGILSFIIGWGPLILIGIFFFVMISRQRAMMQGGKPGFGQARTKSADKGSNLRIVTFDDVAGADEAVKELRRIAKGLRRRRLYRWFGAKLPRGVLLVGPPGTGKTLLARALAGETDGTFESTSGSDFVEMFVGVGASRARDMWERGRAKVKETGKPHIIFIDEIDAVGGKRGNGPGEGGGNSEREQTLNAILVEMDGMEDNEGLIIVAATNRVDMLDDALLRPGRFDCQVTVDLPNKAGRTAIFGIHTRNKPLAADVNCALLADRSYGYSGAEIEGACNRAALLAAERYGASLPDDADEATINAALKAANAVIALADFDEGIDFVRYGSPDEARQKGMSEEDKINTTVHEAGHAIASDAMPHADPIVKITMMNRSRMLGFVQNMPGEDRYGLNFEQIVARVVTAMAGRAAQKLILGKIDTGASNDFEQGCQMAYRMVTLWGMSRVGIISVASRGAWGTSSGSGPIAHYGPKLADEIDDEWRRIVNECYLMAKRIIETDREKLEKLVTKLRAEETILAPGWKEFREENPTKVDPTTLVLDISPVEKGGA